MITSSEGREFIKKFEGLRKDVYYCSARVLTVGWGHALTGTDKTLYPIGSKVSDVMIDVWFDKDVAKAEKIVNSWVAVPLTQGQFDALVSFVFNLGPDNFKRSTLLKLINKGKIQEAAAEFPRWVHSRSNGRMKKLPGLVARRKAERAIFLGEHEMV